MTWFDIIQVIGIVVIAIGLYAQWRRTDTLNNRATGAETQKGISRDTRVDNLPCIKDHNYQKEQGKYEQKIDDIIKRLERIEKNQKE